jgi:hypothetical protein
MEQKLNTYIQAARKRDLSDRTIRENLVAVGWELSVVEAALAADLPVPKPPTGSRVQTSATPATQTGPADNTNSSSPTMWDAFEHILMFISMYVLAITIGLTLSLFVEKWFPGAPELYESGNNSWKLSMLRGYIASLIVSYPLFAFFFLRITKRTMDNPFVRTLKARKFLIYLTLVVAFIIVISNIISIIFNFLNGNVTLNFFLNFLIIVSISSLIFFYYLQQVKEDWQPYHAKP